MSIEVDGVNGVIKSTTSDADITIKGNDGGSEISALTLDMSAAGKATFNNDIALGAFTATAASTITTADNTDTLTLTSTDADANTAPNLVLHRNSGSPADNDMIGMIHFDGQDDGGNVTTYARFISQIIDASGSSEDSAFRIQTNVGGTLKSLFSIEGGTTGPGEIVINDSQADMDFRVESNNDTHMLFVDSGNDHVNIGTSTDLGGTLNVSGTGVFQTADNTDTLTLKSTDDDTAEGPVLKFTRDPSGVADGDLLGTIKFVGDDAGGNTTDYFELQSSIGDEGANSEDGRLTFYGMVDGTVRNVLDITHSNIVFNQDSQDIDFRVEGNGNTHMLFVDAGNDRVGIGTSSPVVDLHVKNSSTDAQIIIQGGSTDANAKLMFYNSADSERGRFLYDTDGNFLQTKVNTAEVMRINSSGNVGIGTTSPGNRLHVLKSANTYVMAVENTNSTPYGLRVQYTDGPDNSDNQFFEGDDENATRFRVLADGDVKNHDNSYGSLSDERIKQDIRDSNSQWDDIKAVKVRNFKKKDDVRQYGDKAWEQIGVIAQELETVSPKLIRKHNPSSCDIISSSEFGTLYTSDDAETQDAVLYAADDQEVIDGDKNVGDIKTPSTKKIGDVKEIKEQVKSVNYSILYMKAIKALQEAMTKIETLETKVKALEDA